MGDLQLLPEAPTRAQVERLEGYMLEAEAGGHGVHVPAWHHFAPGLMSRTILILAGTCLTGAAHRSAHLNIAHGDITVWTDTGMRRLTGYHVLPAKAGVKRVGLAHADTHWTTVHANPDDCQDIDELERRLVEDPETLQSRRLVLTGKPLKELV